MKTTMKVIFDRSAWEDYVGWQVENKVIFKRINELIKAMLRDPYAGPGKPEPLKHALAGCWSRRIAAEHRLVYAVREDVLHILQCRFHYGQTSQ